MLTFAPKSINIGIVMSSMRMLRVSVVCDHVKNKPVPSIECSINEVLCAMFVTSIMIDFYTMPLFVAETCNKLQIGRRASLRKRHFGT
ncbi:hypothetical protein GJ496_006643 [Pomphorhynchus laevis]|nr:hypothetical protein GJ496_006643 [Pomphorhynchus laevis]